MGHPYSRILSIVLALSLMCAFFAGPGLAETAELKTTQQFLAYLKLKDIKYSFEGRNGSNEEVTVAYSMDNFDSVTCHIFFDEDVDTVSLRIWNIVTATAGKNHILSTVNSLNADYKFGKFVLDENDNTIQVELDMYIDPDHCAESVYGAMSMLLFEIDNDEIAEKLHSLE